MKGNINCDTLSIYDALKQAGYEEAQAKTLTRIVEAQYKKLEKGMFDKVDIIADRFEKSMRKDHIFGFIGIALAIFIPSIIATSHYIFS